MQECTRFALNSAVLYARIEEIKKNPPPKFVAYKAEHPEFRTVNCALLADYAGLSESTLKNLKLGKITDCNCSTAYLICTALDIDPRDYLRMVKISDCNPDTCPNAKPRAEDGQAVAMLTAQLQYAENNLAAARALAMDQAMQLGAAKATTEALQQTAAERAAVIARQGKIIIAAAAALLLSLAGTIALLL